MSSYSYRMLMRREELLKRLRRFHIFILIILSFCIGITGAHAGCVSGDCINGVGTYESSDGTGYSGEFRNGVFFRALEKKSEAPVKMGLENPDGFYEVDAHKILSIKAAKEKRGKVYSVKKYVVKSNTGIHTPGQLLKQGYWFASREQFYTEYVMIFEKRQKCSGGYDKSYAYSWYVVPDDRIPLGNGETCTGYKMINQAPPGRLPDKQICLKVKIPPYLCTPRCVKWGENRYHPVYYVRDRSTAFRIFQYLNSSGYTPAAADRKFVMRERPLKEKNPIKLPAFTGFRSNFIGIWKGRIANQAIELVLWANPKINYNPSGVAYLPECNCLMMATFNKDENGYALIFDKNFETYPEHNCQGSKTQRFAGLGYITLNKTFDTITFRVRKFYLGKEIIKDWTNVTLKRSLADKRMVEILKNYNSRIIGKPNPAFIATISDGSR